MRDDTLLVATAGGLIHLVCIIDDATNNWFVNKLDFSVHHLEIDRNSCLSFQLNLKVSPKKSIYGQCQACSGTRAEFCD